VEFRADHAHGAFYIGVNGGIYGAATGNGFILNEILMTRR
jgi:hypothetical protein